LRKFSKLELELTKIRTEFSEFKVTNIKLETALAQQTKQSAAKLNVMAKDKSFLEKQVLGLEMDIERAVAAAKKTSVEEAAAAAEKGALETRITSLKTNEKLQERVNCLFLIIV
jgi:hypothetical protein